jgi:hypothetical protein
VATVSSFNFPATNLGGMVGLPSRADGAKFSPLAIVGSAGQMGALPPAGDSAANAGELCDYCHGGRAVEGQSSPSGTVSLAVAGGGITVLAGAINGDRGFGIGAECYFAVSQLCAGTFWHGDRLGAAALAGSSGWARSRCPGGGQCGVSGAIASGVPQCFHLGRGSLDYV